MGRKRSTHWKMRNLHKMPVEKYGVKTSLHRSNQIPEYNIKMKLKCAGFGQDYTHKCFVSLTRCWEWAKAELSLSTPERHTDGGGKVPRIVNVGTKCR